MKNNRWDALLMWLASQGQTSWQTVKSGCIRLSAIEGIGEQWMPMQHANHWVRPLISLGHAEFDTASKKVVALPPGVIWSQTQQRGYLYGFWPPFLKASLRNLGFHTFIQSQPFGPTVWSITGTKQKLLQLSNMLEVWHLDDPGLKILRNISSVNRSLDNLEKDGSSPSGTWQQLGFRQHWPNWIDSLNPLEAPGLYRRLSGGYREVLVEADGQRFRLKDREQKQAARWRLSPKVNFFIQLKKRRLLIPRGCPRLPLLVSRGITSSSGRLPNLTSFNGDKWWCYNHVSLRRAKEVARILGQNLKESETTNVF